MRPTQFELVKQLLDKELDGFSQGAPISIKMGLDLYFEFRRKDLLEPKNADFVFWSWKLMSYRGKFVLDDFDTPPEGYEVGKVNP